MNNSLFDKTFELGKYRGHFVQLIPSVDLGKVSKTSRGGGTLFSPILWEVYTILGIFKGVLTIFKNFSGDEPFIDSWEVLEKAPKKGPKKV